MRRCGGRHGGLICGGAEKRGEVHCREAFARQRGEKKASDGRASCEASWRERCLRVLADDDWSVARRRGLTECSDE